ncbi:MAG: heparan-alpha-glucosaminide N-acetyltransferase domain-containing protein [Acidimicrobiia bacterium]|nr:heparan-alpha-glucosaminide N-acetyltransferase domain-containing protein [Acidimicrobiia bacterium]
MTTAASTKTKRIIGLDIARAFAIVGMVIVNFNVVMSNGVAEPAWLHVVATSLEGRAAATFVVLAGIGASLGSRRARETGGDEDRQRAKVTLARRALFLFVIGWLFYPIWPADILHFYGVYLAIGSMLLFTSDRTLFRVGAGAALVSILFIVGFDYFANWNLDELSYDGVATPGGFLRNLFLDGLHPVLPWIAFYLFGMWLGRTNMRDRAWRRKLAYWSLAALVAVESAAWVVLGPKGSTPAELSDESWRWLFSVEMLPPMPLYLVAGAATAVLVIIGSMMLGERLPERATAPVVHTGQLALTLYVAHVIVGFGILEAMGRLEDQSLEFIFLASLLFTAAAIAYSTWWRRRHARGPLEWVMRKLSG